MTRKTVLALLMLPVLGSGPALSQDADFVGREPCGIFCKVWRNLSGHVNLPASATRIDNTSYERRPQDETIQAPRPNRIVAVHGEVMVETRAERLRRERERQAMLKSITADPNEATPPVAAGRTARTP